MRSHVNKPRENKNEASNTASEKQNNMDADIQFFDNRSATIAQRKLRETINSSPRVKQLEAIRALMHNSHKTKPAKQSQNAAPDHESRKNVPQTNSADQKMRAAELPVIQMVKADQEDLIDIYHDDSDFNKTIKMLDGIHIIEVSKLEFFDGKTWTEKSSKGLTLPHENPPVVFINQNLFGSQEEIASTIYHEAHHAYDSDTPARNDNSEEAMRQDFINEAKTQQIEAERALARGDEITIKALLKQKKLIIGKVSGKPEVNTERLEHIANGNYSNYAKVSRSQRFNINSYKYQTVADFKPGSWSAIIDKGYEADDESD